MKKAVLCVVAALFAVLLSSCASVPEAENAPSEQESPAASAPPRIAPDGTPPPSTQNSGTASAQSPAVREPALPPPVDLIYRIGPGDKVEVTVYGQPDLSGVFTVLSDGSVKYPLIGSVRLADLGAKEAGEKIESSLEERFLVDAQVSVNVKEFLARSVNVLGSVNKPGKYYLKVQTTVTDVLTEAGGLKAESGDTVVIARRIADRKTGVSYTKTFTLNLAELLKGQNSDLNVILADGDTVNIPERMLFYVSGEVARPGSYKLDTGMTLLKAISAAGGLGKFASRRGVEIHRKIAGSEQVLKFNLSRIEAQDDPDPTVMAEDVIIVGRRFF